MAYAGTLKEKPVITGVGCTKFGSVLETPYKKGLASLFFFALTAACRIRSSSPSGRTSLHFFHADFLKRDKMLMNPVRL